MSNYRPLIGIFPIIYSKFDRFEFEIHYLLSKIHFNNYPTFFERYSLHAPQLKILFNSVTNSFFINS